MGLNYQIEVEGLVIGGHPHLELFTNLTVASRRFDVLAEEHKHYNINLIEFQKVVIKSQKKIEREIARCPRGHSDLLYNERPAVVRGSDGLALCNICGWMEGEII